MEVSRGAFASKIRLRNRETGICLYSPTRSPSGGLSVPHQFEQKRDSISLSLPLHMVFHLVRESEIATGSRHPRNRLDWPKVGIFAQRGKNRPNRIGVTICRLLSVENLSLELAGLDVIFGAPVLDIKPGQSLVVERLGEPRAQRRSETIFDACSACRVRASTLPASAQPRRACLPPSGAGSRQGLWRLPR